MGGGEVVSGDQVVMRPAPTADKIADRWKRGAYCPVVVTIPPVDMENTTIASSMGIQDIPDFVRDTPLMASNQMGMKYIMTKNEPPIRKEKSVLKTIFRSAMIRKGIVA